MPRSIWSGESFFGEDEHGFDAEDYAAFAHASEADIDRLWDQAEREARAKYPPPEPKPAVAPKPPPVPAPKPKPTPAEQPIRPTIPERPNYAAMSIADLARACVGTSTGSGADFLLDLVPDLPTQLAAASPSPGQSLGWIAPDTYVAPRELLRDPIGGMAVTRELASRPGAKLQIIG